MKIAMYVPAWPPGFSANGIVTYAGHLIPALRSAGHEVFVLTHQASDSDPYLINLRTYSEPPTLWQKALYKISESDALHTEMSGPLAMAVRGLVEKHGVEVLEIEESFGLGSAVSRLNLIPVCVRLHGPWFLHKRYQNKRRERLEQRAIECAEAVTSPSSYVMEAAQSRYKMPKVGKVYPNPITIPNERWDGSRANSLLFVGRFDHVKGGDLVLKAFAKLAEANTDLSLTFVGPDHSINGVTLMEYANSILSPNAIRRLTYLGAVGQSEIFKLRTTHRVTLCASRQENLPYAVMEAMALGCPIVSSDAGGIPEMIEHDHSGLLFKSGDADALAFETQKLLDDPTQAKKLAENARHAAFFYRPTQAVAHALDTYLQSIDRFKSRGQIQWAAE